MNQHKFVLSLLFATVILPGCGGGGGGYNGSSFSGTVIDGLIEGAKVCLDLNKNLACDTGEPFALTDKDGKYEFSYSGEVEGLHVVAEVTASAKDKDDNGQTIGQAGKEPFNLAAPATRPEVVTPLTTMVSQIIVADPSIKTDTAGLKEAEDRAKANVGLQVDLLGNNYVAKSNTKVHDVARVVSVALGDVAKEVKAQIAQRKTSDNELSKSSDTAAGQKVIQERIMKSVTEMVATNLDSSGNLKRPREQVIQLLKQEVSTKVSGQINNIIAGTKAGEVTVASAEALFKKGLIIGSDESGQLENGTVFKDMLRIETIKIEKLGSTFKEYSSELVLYKGSSGSTPTWLKQKKWGKEFILSKDNQWIYNPPLYEGSPTNGDIVFDKNCATFKVDKDKVTANDQVCFLEKDLSGKKIAELISTFCNSDEKIKFPNCRADALFKSGSIGYDITFAVSEDQYRNSVSHDWDGYPTKNDEKTVSAFIEYHRINNSWLGNNCNTGFRVKSYDASKKTGVMEWGDFSDRDCSNAYQKSFNSAEETDFEVKMIGSIEMLILTPSAIYNKNNQNDRVGQKTIFNYMSDSALGRTGIYSGEFTPKSVKRQYNFSGQVKVGTHETLDSYLEGLGVTAYPYPTTQTPVVVSP